MNIWIMNHYATQMYKDKAGRHYWFAKKLIERGHNVTIFCATTFLNGNDKINTNGKRWLETQEENIHFVFVDTPKSTGNGMDRVMNMGMFFLRLMPAAKKMAQMYGVPNVIIASSVHPLTMVAGIKVAKKLKVPCICEIRDLWPETIFSFGKAKENSLLGKALIAGEHWIYRKADALIFTKEGDTDYLKERKWTVSQGGDIDINKCHYINNGIDCEAYEWNIKHEILDDLDLDDNCYNIVYAGTIRPINNVGNLVEAAKIVAAQGYNDIKFLIYGDGVQREELEKRVEREHIQNVKFKGSVEKKYIPYILSKSSVNLLNYSQNQYNWTRGNSSNKLFEYMASGKPIISTVHMGYSIINKYKCGVELKEDSPQCLADEIIRFYNMDKREYERYGMNAKEGAKNFDFNVLTDKLEQVINEVV